MTSMKESVRQIGAIILFAVFFVSLSLDVSADNGLVEINDLQNYTSLKKSCTDAEFQAAYDAAREIVQPLVGQTRKKQVKAITYAIRDMVDSGKVHYSMDEAHYNDPYGYFCLGVGSCAGSTRATGLCLHMLGIPYEHINENQYSHQWVRVKLKEGYWIADAYGLYVGKELSPCQHPYK